MKQNIFERAALWTAVLALTATAAAPAELFGTNALTLAATNLVTDSSGIPVLAGSGFVAIGSFDVADSEVVAAGQTAAAGSYFNEHFTVFHTAQIGVGGVPGLYEVFAPPPAAGSGLIGEPVYTLIGNGQGIGGSSAFLVYKHPATFEARPPGVFFSIEEIFLSESAGGTLLVGGFDLFQAGVGPFEVRSAFSLAESGSVTVAGIPSEATVEPGATLQQFLTATPGPADFQLIDGPPWVQISPNGNLTAQPPSGSSGSYRIVVRAVGAEPGGGTFETGFDLEVAASFAAWQARNFNLPAESALAGPLEDPDGDRIPNLLEYAVREENGTDSSLVATPILGVDGQGHLTASLEVRDDDPALAIWFEITGDLTFDPAESVGVEELPFLPPNKLFRGEETNLGNGWMRLTFRDPAPIGGASQTMKYVRMALSLDP